MRELLLLGAIALAFGLGSYYATKELGAFSAVNLAAGALALAAAAALGLRRLGAAGTPGSRRLLARHLALGVATLAVAVLLERAAHRARLQFDWTLEQRYELSPATREALSALPDLEAILFQDPEDPRIRSTRTLLARLAEAGDVSVRERILREAPDEEDRYEIPGSNSVVLVAGGRFETVARPTEGTLFEALSALRPREPAVLYLARGEGEGDAAESGEGGFSGLAAALQTEGYRLREFVGAAAREVPADASALIVIAPRRPLRPETLAALGRYLARGGRLVAFLEPGAESGLEGLLTEWGIRPGDGILVDPASGPIDGVAVGLAPVAYNYAMHGATAGLDATRMTLFRGVRPLLLRKPRVEDDLRGVVLGSGRSWIHPDASLVHARAAPAQPTDAREDYHPIVAAGRYTREGGETRIVVFGDSDLASNRYLRALYNLDLVVNSVHWAVERESAITLRPKAAPVIQFPLPVQNTLTTLYGVGLLIPELLLAAGAFVWLRRRAG